MMFSAVGFSQPSAHCVIFVGMVLEASFKGDLEVEGRDKEVSFTSLEMRE